MLDFSLEDRVFLLRTACQTIRGKLEGLPAPPPISAISPRVIQPAGCFVSLHARMNHNLRGCMGRIDASGPLLSALQSSAWSVVEDHRFKANPVTLAELPQITVELSILSPLRSAASPMDFDLLNHGVYLTVGNRSGLFLPQVARETGWNREQLLSRLCAEKLGIAPNAWQAPEARLYTFSVQILGPTDFP